MTMLACITPGLLLLAIAAGLVVGRRAGAADPPATERWGGES